MAWRPHHPHQIEQSGLIYRESFAIIILLALVIVGCQPGQTPDDTLFQAMSVRQTGIDFINKVEEEEDFNVFTFRNYYNGGGVAIGDVNQDSFPDIYFTANKGPNQLYLNKGNWKFENVTQRAGVGGTKVWSTGTTMVDVNADGWLDIYVANSGNTKESNKENELFINQRDGTFVEKAAEYGLNDGGFSTHASFFDYDQDGDLDCYILNNSFIDPRRMRLDQANRSQIDSLGGDKLFRNEGGKFVNVTEESGIFGSSEGFGLGVSVSDLNNDRLPDIYISNDFWERDYLYINRGNGTFSEELIQRLGLCPASSMGADIGDLNNDGLPEIYTTDMLPGDNFRIKTMTMFDPYLFDQSNFQETYFFQMLQNCLQVNLGSGHFQERAHLSGVAATDWSWGALLFDFDNDGLRDILVCNGIYRNITDMDFTDFVMDETNVRRLIEEKGKFDARDLLPGLRSTPLSNYAFQNAGELKFQNRASELGLDQKTFSNGAAYGDLDGDGDYDLVINNENMVASIYQNHSEMKNGNHYLKVKFHGPKSNLWGIGAIVEIKHGDQIQNAQHFLSRGFESSVEPGLLFGLGETTMVDELIIHWPDGPSQILQQIEADQTLVLNHSDAVRLDQEKIDEEEVLFADVTQLTLNGDFRHLENNFNDFENEPLLWRMLSTEGPEIVVGDVDQDGLEDFILLGSAGHPDRLFKQNQSGQFHEMKHTGLETGRAQESTCGAFGDVDGDGDLDLFIGSGGNEVTRGPEHFMLRYYENDGDGRFLQLDYRAPMAIGNFSCVEAADYDKDGDVDLFIGARSVPGNYGLVPRNFLYRNEGNFLWSDVTTKAIGTMGMVTDATWSDYDNDKDLDLIVVGEWMPVNILLNRNDRIEETLILPGSEGWWNCVEVADLNGDRLKEIVLGNWGLNSKFSATSENPLQMWVKDFDQNKKSEFILQWRPPLEAQHFPFPTKKDLTRQLPQLANRLLSQREYALQTYETIFTDEERAGALSFQARRLASGVYWNRDSLFEWVPFPDESQVAPVMTICIDDLDNDGMKDVWLGGNLFGVKPEVGHLSENHGVFLKGSKEENFTFLNPQQSGIYLKGEVRDAVTIKASDKQKTFLVARNNDTMLAFRRIELQM